MIITRKEFDELCDLVDQRNALFEILRALRFNPEAKQWEVTVKELELAKLSDRAKTLLEKHT